MGNISHSLVPSRALLEAKGEDLCSPEVSIFYEGYGLAA